MTGEVLETLDEKVNPAHTAVIVVDVQNDFCAPEGYYGKTGADLGPIRRMIPRLRSLLDAARSARVPLVFARTIYDDRYMSAVQKERHIRRFGSVIPACQSGTWGAEFYAVAPAAEDTVVIKHRYSAFHGTDLHVLLRSGGIRTVVLTGVATNVCVESTARDAFMHDYYAVVVEDCTAARTEALHRGALASIEGHFGVVADAAAVMRSWDAKTREGGHGPRAER